MIKGTGVFATKTQIEICRDLAVKARGPVVKVHGVWLHEAAHKILMETIDSMAMAAGLPAPRPVEGGGVDHYGMSHDGEFTVRGLDK
jgi:hypothetical protein